jgi:NADH-quinone oxidoreductase subunit N
VLNSVVSVYYYFRIMIVMYMKESPAGQPGPEPISLPTLAIVTIAAIWIVWLGVYPAQILNLAANSTLALK